MSASQNGSVSPNGRDVGFGVELEALRGRIDRMRAEPEDARQDVLLAELEAAHEELRVADEEVRVQAAELERLIEGQRTARWMHERIVALLPAPVVVTDALGVIDMVNAAAAALLQMRVDRVLGRPLFMFVQLEDRATLRRRLTAAVAKDRNEFRTTVRITPRDGEPTSVDVAAILRTDGPQDRTEVVWVLLDNATQVDREPAGLDGSRLARALVDLSQLPLSTSAAPDLLTRVAAICERAFPHTVSVSISVGEPSEPAAVATDSRLAQAVDLAQTVANEGPCEEAWATGEVVRSADLHEDPRWPRLQRSLRDNPAHGALAIPIRTGDDVVGALNVYSEAADWADDTDVETAELLASSIAAVLHETHVRSELESVATELRRALESRASIDQAKGMIMATQGCGPDEAFRVLSRASSNANVKLRDIAARMVEEATQGMTVLLDQREDDERG